MRLCYLHRDLSHSLMLNLTMSHTRTDHYLCYIPLLFWMYIVFHFFIFHFWAWFLSFWILSASYIHLIVLWMCWLLPFPFLLFHNQHGWVCVFHSCPFTVTKNAFKCQVALLFLYFISETICLWYLIMPKSTVVFSSTRKKIILIDDHFMRHTCSIAR